MLFKLKDRELCNSLPNELALRVINADQLSIMRKNRADAKEYLNMRESQSHPDLKVPMLTGTNVEEFDLAFTASVRRQNALIGIPLDYLLRTDAIGNYDADWNSREEDLKFCANLQGQAFNDDAETL